ncbi:MAG: hypothetical protein Q7S20_12495 [Gemmatimonadaceae bacterium]|nr:hypothetical protein [Gemmatimonadaceae bacterium]
MRSPRWLFILPLMGCSLPAPNPPAAEFLVADAASTYWVRSGPRGISARNSPLILTSAGDRFYEVYVDEVTRSYEDAVFTGEPIYSRELLSGRKRLLYEDARVGAWEKAYLTRNPDARLLDPDEDGSEDVSVAATGESAILAVAGPYVLYDRRVTLERDDFQQSDSSSGAIDVRSGESVSLASLVRDTAILGAGGVREGDAVRWRHGGYDVVARWDGDRSETDVVLRDLRGHEWPLGQVSSRLPRIFWLDVPRVDPKLRTALATAFEDARTDDVETQLVRHRGGSREHSPRLTALGHRTLAAAGSVSQ